MEKQFFIKTDVKRDDSLFLLDCARGEDIEPPRRKKSLPG